MRRSILCYQEYWYFDYFRGRKRMSRRTHNSYCDVNTQCKNAFGSFDCTCIKGYTGNGVAYYGVVARLT